MVVRLIATCLLLLFVPLAAALCVPRFDAGACANSARMSGIADLALPTGARHIRSPLYFSVSTLRTERPWARELDPLFVWLHTHRIPPTGSLPSERQ